MQLTSLFVLSLATLAVRACPGENHDHARQQVRRAHPQKQLLPPTKQLEWSDINIIHTTDSHGWLLGHQKPSFPEPNYSGDLGDFASFVTHMKDIAKQKDVDLLLVDTGDLHDGTGLSDGYPAGGVDGHETNNFIFELPYDVMAIGNHELYDYDVTLDMHKNFAPRLQGRYLSSNVEVSYLEQGHNVTRPVGDRFVTFRTRKGRVVTALGVLFNFSTDKLPNRTVQKVEEMVKEQWFADAIKVEPDLFLLAGHMPVKNDSWPAVFKAVRAVHPTTPIIILGGHTHVRDCTQLDGRSMALESGRYMETVGWLSTNLDKPGSTTDLKFSRRYLDANRVTYQYHTGRDSSTFDTQQGLRFTKGLNDLAANFSLSHQYGVASQDYTLYQANYTSDSSLYSVLTKAMPYSLSINNIRSNIPNIIIINAEAMRFDVYKGPFTKNDVLTASSYKNPFLYIANVTLSVASKVLDELNSPTAPHAFDTQAYAEGDIDTIYRAWLEGQARGPQDSGDATPGYVTHDNCPGDGDDIVHTPLNHFRVPDYIQSDPPPGTAANAGIDLVFIDLLKWKVPDVLNKLQTAKQYSIKDVSQYSDVVVTQVLQLYAEKFWH